MSAPYQNKFSLLADDIEDPDASASSPTPEPKEVVKQSKSTKKVDEPPKSARPENARPRAARSGNEDALRDKAAGRSANRSRPVDSEAPARGGRGGRGRGGRGGSTGTKRVFDRQSNAPADSEKQVQESWGSAATEWKDEAAAATDVANDLTTPAADGDAVASPTEEAVEEDNSKTLDEYLAELQLKTAELGPKLPTRKPNEGEDPSTWGTIITKEPEVDDSNPFISGLKPKTKETKAKAKKEKNVIEFEPQFADPAGARRGGRGGARGGRGETREPREERSERGDRGGRGGRGGRGRGGRGGAPASSAPRSSAPRSSPAINLTNLSEFPALS